MLAGGANPFLKIFFKKLSVCFVRQHFPGLEVEIFFFFFVGHHSLLLLGLLSRYLLIIIHFF